MTTCRRSFAALIPVIAVGTLALPGCGSGDGGGGDGTAVSVPSVPEATVPKPSVPKPSVPEAVPKPAAPATNSALAALDRKCDEGPSQIVSYAAKAEELLRQSGQDESLDSIITHVNQSLPESLPAMQCSQVFAAYVTLRQGSG